MSRIIVRVSPAICLDLTRSESADWRGFVWGPMAQLTYWSLAEYDHVPVVRSARKAMCKQMTAMFLNQWRLHAHICENFVRPATVPDRLKRFRFAASDTVLLSAEPTQERDRGGGQGVAGRLHGLQVLHWGALTGMISLIEEGHW